MMKRMIVFLLAAIGVPAVAAAIDPAALPAVGHVDERFQSYNVEMVEVTGGRFWKPYHLGPPRDASDRNSDRAPTDLSNPRLRMLAAALGPAYLRVSGTGASTTGFAGTAAAVVMPGFDAVLTADRWRALIDFARVVRGDIVISAAASAGTRDGTGVWQPAQLGALLAATRAAGGRIAAAEFINEPNLLSQAGTPPDYTAADYGRDFKRFRDALHAASPATLVLGPGSVGEGSGLTDLSSLKGMRLVASESLLAAAGPPDVFSYHHYNALSQRCAASGPAATTRDAALDAALLDRTERSRAFYGALRDRTAPGRPLWVSETGQAACGGSPWAATFADTFRYLDQLGRLARNGVAVVMHQTLAASDYALLDENDFTPRPSYWGALLWHRLMGTTVLDAGRAPPTLRLYAHCLSNVRGGVAVLAINLDRTRAEALSIGGSAARYTLSSPDALNSVLINDKPPPPVRGHIPAIAPAPGSGTLMLAPASITFLAFAKAANPACRS